MDMYFKIGLVIVSLFMLFLIVYAIACKVVEKKALRLLGLSKWKYTGYDEVKDVKSARTVDGYTVEKFCKENKDSLDFISDYIGCKEDYASSLEAFLSDNTLMKNLGYSQLKSKLKNQLANLHTYNVLISYVSPAGKKTAKKVLRIYGADIEDPEQYMSETERRKLQKGKEQELLKKKQDGCFDKINKVIDIANTNRDNLLTESDKTELDRLISGLFEQVGSIRKIKTSDSKEWDIVKTVIINTTEAVTDIVKRNNRILDYYASKEFAEIKGTCNSLMESQREFNEYINEKAQSISNLFGSRVVRNETETADEYNYIRPYKKSVTPFTAEVSSTVFASAENNPLDYIVKSFYPDKALYPEQIQKLQLLVEELETLKDARQIIENYKKDYQQYLSDVPDYVMEADEEGFYTRLGFANISESVLTVEYKFSYTSDGGMARRSFTVPMTEETVVALIEKLQSKLTMTSFAKEQRSLMTSKLRQKIKERDDYTCKFCGNSTHKEPNLLLEIDHILPVAKGGCTVEENLQTLCWKCNRQKSDRII